MTSQDSSQIPLSLSSEKDTQLGNETEYFSTNTINTAYSFYFISNAHLK